MKPTINRNEEIVAENKSHRVGFVDVFAVPKNTNFSTISWAV